MRITCPSCSLSYQIPRDSVGDEGRTVRCSQCKTAWFVAAPTDQTQVPPVTDVDVEAPVSTSDAQHPALAPPIAGIESVAAQRYKPLKSKQPLKKYAFLRQNPGIVVLGIVVLMLSGMAVLRTPIVQRFPNLASLYARIGLPVNLRGIDVLDVVTKTEYEDGQPVVIVEGRLQNISKNTIQVPHLRVAARSVTGGEIYAWRVIPSRPLLGVREAVAFRTKFPNPPTDAQSVEVRFVTAKDKNLLQN